MMDNLDDFIKGKLNQAPVEFNEAHWMQAAQLIDQQIEDKRRRLLGWSFLGQLVIFAILAVLITVDGPHSNSSAPEVFVSGTHQPESTIDEFQSEITTEDVQSKGISENQQTELYSTTNAVEKSPNHSTVNHPVQATPINSNLDNPSQKQIEKTNSESSIENEIQIQDEERVVVAPLTVINHSTPSQPKEEGHDNANVNQDFENKTNAGIVLNSTQEDRTLHPSETLLNPNEAELENDPNKEMAATQMLGITQYLTNELKLLDNLPTSINKKSELYEEKNPFRSSISFYVASTMYPYTQVGAKKLLGYTAGADYTVNIKKAWSIDLGFHYRVREGSFTNSQNTQQDSFSFGRIRTEHALQANQLHSLELPLAVSFNKKRHQILLGVNYARLLGLKGNLNKIDDPENVPISTIIDKGWFDDTQFKTNRFDLLMGYYFTIKPGLRLGANVHYALGGFQNKETPVDLYVESKPLFIDFGIRYDLLNR